MKKAGAEKNKTAVIQINWPQSILRVHYEDAATEESVKMEDANISEQCDVKTD